MRVLIVTGTPSTGKTTLSKKLSEKLNYQYIDVNKIIEDNNLSDGFDKKRNSKIIDVKKLNKALTKEINKYKSKINKNNNKKSLKNKKIIRGMIIDSHLSHYLPKKYVDLCIVTKCDLKILQKRLKKRKYNKDKIRENLDAEIFDVCLNEAKEKGHNVIAVDSTENIKINDISNEIKNLL
jgi:adenylate kinase